jgi:predicted transposase YbfD/YdcC
MSTRGTAASKPAATSSRLTWTGCRAAAITLANRAFPTLKTIGMVESTVEKAGRTSTERRFYISSAALGAERFAGAVRAHWGIENQLHWVLDVQFNEDQSRLRTGHGAKNMAVVRHFAINLVRGAGDKRSIKTRRKLAGWDTNYLHSLISPSPG